MSHGQYFDHFGIFTHNSLGVLDISSYFTYLGILGQDIDASFAIIKELGYDGIYLKNLNNTNVMRFDDKTCQAILSASRKYGLPIISLFSNVGCVDPQLLDGISDDLKRILMLAEYFKVESVRIVPAVYKEPVDRYRSRVLLHIVKCANAIVDCGLTPLIEPAIDNFAYDISETFSILDEVKQLKLIYDPSGLIINKRIDPNVEYWPYFSERTYVVEYKDTLGGYPVRPGDGDCHWNKFKGFNNILVDHCMINNLNKLESVKLNTQLAKSIKGI